jgi:hypothetical protein
VKTGTGVTKMKIFLKPMHRMDKSDEKFVLLWMDMDG